MKNLCCVLLAVSFMFAQPGDSGQQNKEWNYIENMERYYNEVLDSYNNGHYPWRADSYEVAKEFLISSDIDNKISEDVELVNEEQNTFTFKTEDSKLIDVQVIAPFDDIAIYFVDKYRYDS